MRLTVRGLIVVAAISAGIWAVQGAARAADPVADGRALAAAGQRTADRLQKDGAAWRMTMDLRQGAVVVEERMVRGLRTRVQMWTETGPAGDASQKTMLMDLIARDGAWYVREGKAGGGGSRREKYRPFEAPFAAPGAYMLLSLGDVRTVAAEPLLQDLTRGPDGQLVRRVPLDPQARSQLSGLVAQFKQAMAANSNPPPPPELARVRTQLEDLLDYGALQVFDEKLGIVLTMSNVRMRLDTRDFRFLTAADDKAFDVDPAAYTDLTGPVSDDMHEVVLLGHAAEWTPGHDVGDLDPVLVNLKTGAIRRAPFVGIGQPGGCFSADRTKLWMSGMDAGQAQPGLHLREVDLKTGENRMIGGASARGGINIGVRLSRDGELLCFRHQEIGAQPTAGSLIVHGLASNREQTLATGDTGLGTWTLGNEVVFERREVLDVNTPTGPIKFPRRSIRIVSLEGTEREVARGTMPVVLGDGQTILYQDELHMWTLCDLVGKNERRLGDGLEKYSFPAAAPDGKRVLMMRYPGNDAAPEPVIVTLADGTVTPVKVGPGFWGLPAW